MSGRTFLNGRVTLFAGDCRKVLAMLPENSFDSAVCDPPYGLEFMGVAWDTFKNRPKGRVRTRNEWGDFGSREHPRKASESAKIQRAKAVAFEEFSYEWASAVLRVLKPGGHLLAFGAPKNAHRLFCAIEDGGFEIRDSIQWIFGSGFPKSHDVSKGIDKAAGAERKIVGKRTGRAATPRTDMRGGRYVGSPDRHLDLSAITAPATDAAADWQGWGTALKPAYEPICLSRKPLSEASIAANVLRWGTGAINIDGCRVEHVTVNGGNLAQNTHLRSSVKGQENAWFKEGEGARFSEPHQSGRWPANVIHDGSDEVLAAFPDAPGAQRAVDETFAPKVGTAIYGDYGRRPYAEPRGDSGSAARYFYTSKADADDRIGSKHPTVKPLDLMQYLVRLVTPPRGVILDPFAGTGTTAEAAWREGFSAVLIEREPEYLADIERRMSLCLAGPDERARESIKARQAGKPEDHGPLFAEVLA